MQDKTPFSSFTTMTKAETRLTRIPGITYENDNEVVVVNAMS